MVPIPRVGPQTRFFTMSQPAQTLSSQHIYGIPTIRMVGSLSLRRTWMKQWPIWRRTSLREVPRISKRNNGSLSAMWLVGWANFYNVLSGCSYVNNGPWLVVDNFSFCLVECNLNPARLFGQILGCASELLLKNGMVIMNLSCISILV